jgi:hypothetical protein
MPVLPVNGPVNTTTVGQTTSLQISIPSLTRDFVLANYNLNALLVSYVDDATTLCSSYDTGNLSSIYSAGEPKPTFATCH